MKASIQREKFCDIMGELPGLFQKHYDEANLDKDGLNQDADYERYIGLENLGVLHCMTARDGDKLVGYLFNMVVYHLHHKGVKTAAADLVYVLPEYRKNTGIGLALVKAAIQEMKSLGVEKIYMAAKKNTSFSSMLVRLGFRHIEDNFSMRIGA